MEVHRVLRYAARSHQLIRVSVAQPSCRTPFPVASSSECQRQLWTGSNSTRRQFSSCLRLREDAKRPSAQGQKDSLEGLDDMLDETLDLNKGTPTAPQGRSSHFASRQAQEERARSLRFSSSEPSTSAGKGSSLQDLLAAFPTEQSRSRAPGSTFGNKMNTDDLQQPSAYPDLTGFTGGQGYQARPVPLPVRLGPNLGRTVKVNPTRNIDVGRAFRQLDILCTRNRVRTDFNRQRFHERPGLRRKRLKRERWRKHFKEGFKGMVALVKKMKKQGW